MHSGGYVDGILKADRRSADVERDAEALLQELYKLQKQGKFKPTPAVAVHMAKLWDTLSKA